MSRLIVETLIPSHFSVMALVLGYFPDAICRSIKHSRASADLGGDILALFFSCFMP